VPPEGDPWLTGAIIIPSLVNWLRAGKPEHEAPRGGECAMTPSKVNKSAKTGKFVKTSTVKKNPSTTYTQTVKKSGKKG
jgi:hypothetical protein